MSSYVRDSATVGTGNTYNALGDSRGVAAEMRYGKATTLASAVEVRDSNADTLNLVVEGKAGTTILLINSHDLALDVDIYIKPVSADANRALIYSADNILPATTGVLIFTPYAGGTGAAAALITVAALASPTYQLDIVLQPTGAGTPGSGSYSAFAYSS